MKNTILIGLGCLCILISCSNRSVNQYPGVYYTIASYERVYFKPPSDINDILDYLGREDGLLVEDTIFQIAFRFFTDNKDRIKIVSDSDYTYLYLDETSNKNLIAEVEHDWYCGHEKALNDNKFFYDFSGELPSNSTHLLLEEDMKVRLRSIEYKYPTVDWRKDDDRNFVNVIIIEYTAADKRMIDFCSKKDIDIINSLYFSGLYNILREFCDEHNVSRVVLDSYIPSK